MKMIICRFSVGSEAVRVRFWSSYQIAILAMLLWLPTLGAKTVTIPSGAETRENTSNFAVPFAAGGDVSSQQIYSPTLFPELSSPGQLFRLDGMAFRLSSLGTFTFTSEATFDRVEILLSTSNGSFTTSFEQNHGENLFVIYDQALTLKGTVPAGTTPSNFDLQIPFTNPFLYNPSAGSLVVEIRKYGAESLSGIAGGSIPGARYYDKTIFGVGTVINGGLDTRFSYQVVPEPRASIILLAGAGVIWMAKRRQA